MARRFFVLGGVLIALGAAGFAVNSPIAGVFEVTPLLNALHIAAGAVALLAATRGLGTMRAWGQILGYTFAAVAVAGFAFDVNTAGSLLPLSTANAWFHLLVALVFLYNALLAPPTP